MIRVLADSGSHETPAIETLRAMEDTIVHELVHLELALLPKTDASRADEEFAVNHLAEALLALDREGGILPARSEINTDSPPINSAR